MRSSHPRQRTLRLLPGTSFIIAQCQVRVKKDVVFARRRLPAKTARKSPGCSRCAAGDQTMRVPFW